jgi:EAL domain-containing protein (putative c-di-GMP-specific phosphodiesterase class I)
MTRDMTERVLQAALRQLAACRSESLDLSLSINLSAANLDEEDLPARLVALAMQYGVPPESLELELTESAVMRNGQSALERMNDLRAAGFNFAIDDFGTGYSSLSYLKTIPTSTVKIDRSFVQDLGAQDTDIALVSAMIS